MMLEDVFIANVSGKYSEELVLKALNYATLQMYSNLMVDVFVIFLFPARFSTANPV
jgi:hypothetical protein